jgi:uncharacterized protein (DUF952 family)
MIYHLTTQEAWEAALGQGYYEHASLAAEGFIHCSTREQLFESARLYFVGHDRLVVLQIVEKRVEQQLKWEHSRNGELFPHLYGPLPVEAVEDRRYLARNEEGQWRFE